MQGLASLPPFSSLVLPVLLRILTVTPGPAVRGLRRSMLPTRRPPSESLPGHPESGQTVACARALAAPPAHARTRTAAVPVQWALASSAGERLPLPARPRENDNSTPSLSPPCHWRGRLH